MVVYNEDSILVIGLPVLTTWQDSKVSSNKIFYFMPMLILHSRHFTVSLVHVLRQLLSP
jgi:hypothetical protein